MLVSLNRIFRFNSDYMEYSWTYQEERDGNERVTIEFFFIINIDDNKI